MSAFHSYYYMIAPSGKGIMVLTKREKQQSEISMEQEGHVAFGLMPFRGGKKTLSCNMLHSHMLFPCMKMMKSLLFDDSRVY